jgi:hypothetical protein
MAIDFGAINDGRFYSSPYSNQFDLPNAAWSILAVYRLHSAADTPHVVSAGGGFGAANSYHLYHSGGVARIKIDGLAAANSGFTVPASADVFAYATRRDNTVYCGAGRIDDPSTWVEGSGVAIASGYVPSSTVLKIGLRSDQTSSPSNVIDGIVSDVIMSRVALSLDMLRGSRFDLPLLGNWYRSRTLHFYGETAQSAGFTDLTGQHIFARNGTGYGNLEQDPPGITRLPKRKRQKVFLPLLIAGTGANLAGDAASHASATGSLDTAIQIAGASATIATATGSLTTQIPLEGIAASVATGAAGLSTGIKLAGNAIAQALSQAGIDTQIFLQSSATAQANSAGALNTGIPLTGEASSQASATGTLDTGSSLSGNAQIEASSTAVLTAQIRLSGSAIVQALASASLSGSAAALAGNASGQAFASGQLSTSIPLAGTAAAIITTTGDLATEIQLTGVSIAQATATGALDLEFTLSGDAVAVVLAGGTLSTQIPLAGFAQAVAAGSGLLTHAAIDAPAGGGYVAGRVTGLNRPAQTARSRPAAQTRARPTYH